ncbi:MAG: hypothetical protein M5U28_13670 [Sandaracinaceae bacterium]|nr:hypothetical protein [Sandaracinaceae bacterium]
MQGPGSIDDARERLRGRLATLGPDETTVGALLEAGRDIHGEVPAGVEHDGEAHLSFETYGRTNAHVTVELIWRWPHADILDARPERLLLRFEAAASARTREVQLHARDYPHTAAFVTAALEAAELAASAPATSVKIEIEHA